MSPECLPQTSVERPRETTPERRETAESPHFVAELYGLARSLRHVLATVREEYDDLERLYARAAATNDPRTPLLRQAWLEAKTDVAPRRRFLKAAEILARAGAWDEALRLLDRCPRQADTSDEGFLRALCVEFGKAGRLAEARAVLAEFAANEREHVEVSIALLLEEARHDPEAARSTYEREHEILERNTGPAPDSKTELTLIEGLLGLDEAALTRVRKAKPANIRQRLTYALAKEGLSALTRAGLEATDHPYQRASVLHGLANAEVKRNDLENARKTMKEYLALPTRMSAELSIRHTLRIELAKAEVEAGPFRAAYDGLVDDIGAAGGSAAWHVRSFLTEALRILGKARRTAETAEALEVFLQRWTTDGIIVPDGLLRALDDVPDKDLLRRAADRYTAEAAKHDGMDSHQARIILLAGAATLYARLGDHEALDAELERLKRTTNLDIRRAPALMARLGIEFLRRGDPAWVDFVTGVLQTNAQDYVNSFGPGLATENDTLDAIIALGTELRAVHPGLARRAFALQRAIIEKTFVEGGQIAPLLALARLEAPVFPVDARLDVARAERLDQAPWRAREERGDWEDDLRDTVLDLSRRTADPLEGPPFDPESIPDRLAAALERGDVVAVRRLGGLCGAAAWRALRATLERNGLRHALASFDLGYVELHVPAPEEAQALFGPHAAYAKEIAGAADQPVAAVRVVNQLLAKLDVPVQERRQALLGAVAEARKAPEAHLRLFPLIALLVDLEDPAARFEALRLAAAPAISDRRFAYFVKRLVEKGELPPSSASLVDPPNGREAAALRHLVQQKPYQVKNVLALHGRGLFAGVPLDEELPTIHEAIAAFGTVTPILYQRFRDAETDGERRALVERVRALKPRFFRNEPLTGLLPPEDRPLLAEMVMAAYTPVGMTFEQVEGFLERLDDRTEDLEGYAFPSEGYPIRIRETSYALRPKTQLDLEPINAVMGLFMGTPGFPVAEAANDPADETGRRKDLEPLFKPLMQTLRGQALTNTDKESLLSPLRLVSDRWDDFSRAFLTIRARLPHETKALLEEAYELLTIFFRDEYGPVLKTYLDGAGEAAAPFLALLESRKRLRALLDDLGDRGAPLPETLDDRLALVARFIEAKVLRPYSRALKKELAKFVPSQEGVDDIGAGRPLRLMASKNAASFFAKAAAGICTAQDVELFNRPDHFHLNLVEDDETVRGNVQAYLIDDPEDPGKKSLLLRGFNPTITLMERMSVASFCAEILRVGREFQEANGLAGLYLTEDLGGWHALSNRHAVQTHLVNKVLPGCEPVQFEFPITAGASVRTVFRVPAAEPARIAA